jgi:hypothetical protein
LLIQMISTCLCYRLREGGGVQHSVMRIGNMSDICSPIGILTLQREEMDFFVGKEYKVQDYFIRRGTFLFRKE